MSELMVIEITIPTQMGDRIFSLISDLEDETKNAWFITNSFKEEGSSSDLIPTPLPKPLQKDTELLDKVETTLLGFGYKLMVPKVQQH